MTMAVQPISSPKDSPGGNSLYLSLLTLSPRSRQVRTEIRDPYQMHRTLSRAWTTAEEDEAQKASLAEARMLFRVEERKAALCVLVQSQIDPDWNALQAVSGYLATPPQVQEWTPHFRENAMLAFRLRANPTVKREGKRRALVTEAEQENWLKRKAEEGGFSIARVGVTSDNLTTIGKGGCDSAVFNTVLYNGLLHVTDATLFTHTLKDGIGSAKGFGFGLLSLSRP